MKVTDAALALVREARADVAWTRVVDVRSEVLAGVVGAFLVVPQAITFAYLVGVPPQYGLYCAIFVGFVSSLLGSSPLVGGPNTAMSILIGSTCIQFAGRGSPLFIEFVLALSLLVGLIQLLIWILRGAELFRYFSPAAIIGIKVGVGVLLITSALESALGIAPLATSFFYERFYLAVVTWGDIVNPYAAVISGVTILAGLLLKKRLSRSYIVIALILGGVTSALLYGWYGAAQLQVELLGHVRLQTLPLMLPHIGPQQWLFLEQTFPSAVAIAVLGLAQTLVIARDLKSTVAGDVNLHKEVFAQGVANTLSPFFSSFAGSGSFNRTSVAVEMGARTPLAGMVAAVGVALMAWVLAPLLTWLPMPAIAGVLALVGIGMIQGNNFRLIKNRIEGSVFLVTLSSVVLLGLEIGLFVAVAASVVFFVLGAAKVNFAVAHEGDIECITVSGNLFYASLDRLTTHLRSDPSAHTVLDLSAVAYCDASARNMIHKVQEERSRRGGRLEVKPACLQPYGGT